MIKAREITFEFLHESQVIGRIKDPVAEQLETRRVEIAEAMELPPSTRPFFINRQICPSMSRVVEAHSARHAIGIPDISVEKGKPFGAQKNWALYHCISVIYAVTRSAPYQLPLHYVCPGKTRFTRSLADLRPRIISLIVTDR